MYTFVAGKGINCKKLNDNFEEVKDDANNNEIALTTISNTALLKDGSNVTQDLKNTFLSETETVIEASGNIALLDNTSNFLTLTGNGTIVLPTIVPDQLAHTIRLVVGGSAYSLNLGTTYHLLTNPDIDTTNPYYVMYIFNKLDNRWYYSISQ